MRIQQLEVIRTVLAALLCGTVFGWAAKPCPAAPGDEPATRPASPADPQAAAEERIKTAQEGFRLATAAYQAGIAPFQELAAWSERIARSAMHPSVPKDRRVAILKEHMDRVREMEENANARFMAGAGTRLDLVAARYARFEAEQWLRDAEAASDRCR